MIESIQNGDDCSMVAVANQNKAVIAQKELKMNQRAQGIEQLNTWLNDPQVTEVGWEYKTGY